MSITNVMKKTSTRIVENNTKKLSRGAKLLESWKKANFLDLEFSKMNENTAENTAVWLTNESQILSQLNEAMMGKYFSGLTPQNILKMTGMTMGHVNRGNIFQEIACQTMNDAFFFIRPYFSRPVSPNGYSNDMARRVNNSTTAANFDDTTNANGEFKNRKPAYELTEDRWTNQLASAPNDATIADGTITIDFAKANTEFGANADHFINGYTVIYADGDEKKVIATQDPSTLAFYVNPAYAAEGKTITVTYNGNGKFTVEGVLTTVTKVNAIGRFDADDDLEGEYLGEEEIRLVRYTFNPKPTTLGLTITNLAQIYLDTTMHVKTQEILLNYGTQTIQSHLDYRAVKQAYQLALTNGTKYNVEFKANYSAATATSGGTKDSYIDNAQTFGSAIDTIGDVLYNDIKRGEITSIVCGPSAGTYLKLLGGFSPKGKQSANGVYKIGDLDGIGIFKVPAEIIPTNQILCVHKNADVENDAAMIFGTLLPIASTGFLPRKEFFSEEGLASYGDVAVINPKYLGIITITGLKDTTTEAA